MTHSPEGLSQWVAQVSTHFAHLSKSQATVLGQYSFGMAVTQSSGRSSVALFLALLLGQSEAAVKERLQDWCKDAADKAGPKRQDLDVTLCFTPLLQWILQWWAKDERRLALALDATTLGQRFTVLAVSVLCGGCAIPVAWTVVPATTPGAWKPHWGRLLEHLRPRLPKGWLVIVLSDRGLWARWLYRKILAQGWHPYMRINAQGQFLPTAKNTPRRWQALKNAAPSENTHWCGEVTCFKRSGAHVACTLLARWDSGSREPWLILTDLTPNAADALWYGLRSWIECGFKDTKRGGLHWEHTKMTHPSRAARLWLAMAVALLWSVAIGSEAEAHLPASGFDALPPQHVARRNQRAARRHRRALGLGGTRPIRYRDLSLFRRGLLTLLAWLIRGAPLPRAHFHSFPWPGEP